MVKYNSKTVTLSLDAPVACMTQANGTKRKGLKVTFPVSKLLTTAIGRINPNIYLAISFSTPLDPDNRTKGVLKRSVQDVGQNASAQCDHNAPESFKNNPEGPKIESEQGTASHPSPDPVPVGSTDNEKEGTLPENNTEEDVRSQRSESSGDEEAEPTNGSSNNSND